MINSTLLFQIRKDLDYWETPIPWMYLDSVGLVTVGCGTMLPNSDAAAAIPFYHEGNGAAASAVEVGAAWDSLHAESATQKAAVSKDKFGAQHYKSSSDLRITGQTSSDLRDQHIGSDYNQLCLIYVHFDLLPDAAKLALFDMIYNLGAGRAAVAAHAATKGHKATHARKATGLRAFASMNLAIRSGDWESAAASCSRKGIPVERNAMTARQFRSCARSRQDVHI